jgi:hypothetical protein
MTHLDEAEAVMRKHTGLFQRYCSVISQSLDYSGKVFMFNSSSTNLRDYESFKSQQAVGAGPNDEMATLDLKIKNMLDYCLEVGA